VSTESARLADIRAALDEIAPGQWSRAADAAGEFVEARGMMGELVPVARFDPGATRAERAFAGDCVEHVRFLLALVDRAIEFARARGRTDGGAHPSSTPAGGGDLASTPSPSPAATPLPLPGGEDGRSTSAGRNHAAEAAIKCQEPGFKAFLEARHGLERPLTDERVAQRLRSLLGVTSRREINEGGAALERWKQIRADYREWRGR